MAQKATQGTSPDPVHSKSPMVQSRGWCERFISLVTVWRTGWLWAKGGGRKTRGEGYSKNPGDIGRDLSTSVGHNPERTALPMGWGTGSLSLVLVLITFFNVLYYALVHDCVQCLQRNIPNSQQSMPQGT